MDFEKILKEDNNNKLGKLIKDFSKENSSPNVHQVEFLTSQLCNPHYYVRQSAIIALLSRWHIKDEKIINKILAIAKNKQEDFDVRNSAISGLSSVYFNTMDVELMKLLFEIYSDIDEDELIRESSFDALLNIYGISQIDILKKEYDFKFKPFSANVEDKEKIFFEELNKVKTKIKG